MTAPTIALVFQPELRFWQIALARALKEKLGATIHGYCSTAEEIGFYQSRAGDVLASIQNLEADFRRPAAHDDEAALYERARHWESVIGCTFGVLAVGHRHYGRGFALGAPGHPRSRMSEEITLAGMTAGYVAACEAWDRAFRAHGFDLVINGTPLTARLARAHGVPYRTMLSSRTENLHYWTEDEFYYSPRVQQAWEQLKRQGGHREPVDLVRPYMIERTHRARFQRGGSLVQLGRKLGYLTAQRAWHRYKGYEKAKGYYLTENLRYVVRQRTDTQVMTGPMTVTLDALKGKPFVFFPLHTEPEASVGQISPDFFYQHATIAALARDLPSGVTLAVKETIHGIGRRPRDFYRAVADLKNVVWLNMMEYGLEVARDSSAVATITGTAGMEAAVMGKPVIAFGRRNLYNFLPHVHFAPDLRDLAPALARIFNGGIDLAGAVQDGALYLEAVRATSFDMRGYDYIKRHEFSPESVSDGLDALLSTLKLKAVAA